MQVGKQLYESRKRKVSMVLCSERVTDNNSEVALYVPKTYAGKNSESYACSKSSVAD